MLTQLIMLSTVVILSWTGTRFFSKSKEADYSGGKTIALGLFAVAAAILMYSIRDFFIQLGNDTVQYALLQVGGILHIVGSILIFWFSINQFASKSKLVERLSFVIGLLIIIGVVASFWTAPVLSEEFQVHSELIPYTINRTYVDFSQINLIGSPVFLWMGLAPIFLLAIILYNTVSLKTGKKEKTKGFLYGLGFLFLFLPMFACMLISPIFARWGYLVGALLLYKAYKIKV